MRSSSSILFLVLIVLATPLLGQRRIDEREGWLPTEGVLGAKTVALDAAVPKEQLDMLARAGIEPASNIAYEIADVEVVTVAAFREPSGARIFLYHVAPSDIDVFVRVATNDAGQPEVRIWSDGPSEIVIDPSGSQWIEYSSTERFRFGIATNALSVTDTIACIGRALGISLSRSALENGLAKAACSATNTITLILTVTNCFSIPSVGPGLVFGTIGCVNGFAKILSCGIARCTSCELTSISVGRTVSGSFGAPCRSVQKPNSYAKFYVLTLTRRTSVEIDATSDDADPMLYLLKGGSMSSPVLTSNDNGGSGSNARISRTLDAGTYTLEVVSKGTDRGGRFSLWLR